MTKAIFVNAKDRTVTDVEINGLEDLQRLIGGWITTASHMEGNPVYCDDEGLLNGTQDFVFSSHYPQPLAGNLVIVGDDGMGGDADVTLTVEQVKERVVFKTRLEVQRMYA